MRVVIGFSILLLFHNNASCQSASVFVYDPQMKLEWSDFLGRPNLPDSSVAAQISTSIQLSVQVNPWTGRARFKANAIMYREKSWVKPGFVNDYVLAHEQIHFDIAYVTAKRMEEDINKLKINIFNRTLINSVYKVWHSIFLMSEQTYDLMTDGGNDFDMQKYYQQKICNELNMIKALYPIENPEE